MSGPIRWARTHSVLLGNLALIVVMIVGLAYLSFGVLRWEPWRGTYQLTVNFPQSGGLQETSPVTLRGVRIGDVDSIQVQPSAVRVVVLGRRRRADQPQHGSLRARSVRGR